ncbi:MAG: hypothetical protein U0Z75_07415 [Deinococcaceae bacterium]
MLRDLEGLVSDVHFQQTKKHFQEVVRAYQGGAYRSALVALWVTVCVDYFEKIKFLDDIGEPAGKEEYLSWIKAISASNFKEMQKLENDLLDKCKETFQFFGNVGLEDLQKLKRDRNYCAHPSFYEDDLFEASAELVRLHMMNAVKHMLGNPALQGKTIFDMLEKDLISDTFPLSPQNIKEYIQRRYIGKIKQSTLENLFKLLLHKIIEYYSGNQSNLDYEERLIEIAKTVASGLKDMESFIQSSKGETIEEKIHSLDGVSLLETTRAFYVINPFYLKFWHSDRFNGLRRLIGKMIDENSAKRFNDKYFNIEPIFTIITEEFDKTSIDARMKFLMQNSDIRLSQKLIDTMRLVTDFRTCESLLNIAIRYAERGYLDKDRITDILSIWSNERGFWDAIKTPGLMCVFLENLSKNGLFDNDIRSICVERLKEIFNKDISNHGTLINQELQVSIRMDFMKKYSDLIDFLKLSELDF